MLNSTGDRDTRYCFHAAAMGLAPVPRKFTKLTKPILGHLHDLGHAITSFIDHSLLIGQTKAEMYQSVIDTVKVFDSLGFTIHEEKSQLIRAGNNVLGIRNQFTLNHDHYAYT